MINFQREFLTSYGWDDFFESQISGLLEKNLLIGRVVNEEKQLYRIQTGEENSIWAKVAGKTHYKALSRADYPAVGDWVLCDPDGVIRFLLVRKNSLQRKKVGETAEVQILATNVDYVFIATSLNQDLSLGRLERYLTFALKSGARPVILLTKSDLSQESEEERKRVEARCPNVDVYTLSKENFAEATFLSRYLRETTTSVIVGSSGVGKSTLVNFLIGKEIIATKGVRKGDDKGRHTTTSRSVYKSLYGGLIIDTPGMRELQFADHEEGFSEQFSDVEDLVRGCRFSNCRHQTEAGCAVLEALEQGALSLDRWKSYQKIEREVGHELRKQNKWMMAEQKKVWKKRSFESRQKYKGWQ